MSRGLRGASRVTRGNYAGCAGRAVRIAGIMIIILYGIRICLAMFGGGGG
jgi:hypothetical protein